MMSATNIQWITIAVMGFGAIFAFFVLVFVFEATVHALRYRDQYATGGGFRMPGLGGRGGSGRSGRSGDVFRERDPGHDRALAREASRLAGGKRPPRRQSNRRSISDPPPLESPPIQDHDFGGEEPSIFEEADELNAVPVSNAGLNARGADADPAPDFADIGADIAADTGADIGDEMGIDPEISGPRASTRADSGRERAPRVRRTVKPAIAKVIAEEMAEVERAREEQL
ncbi:MAG: hypothetical protein AAGF58_13805, partial [Pseudomonadota bacterium]